MNVKITLLMGWLLVGAAWGADAGAQGHYLALTARNRHLSPFGSASLTLGPAEKSGGARCQWWQFDLRKEPNFDSPPLLQVRVLSQASPLLGLTNGLRVRRYLVKFPGMGELLEYQGRRSQAALLPGWADFERHFFPRRASGSRLRGGLPETCELLGQVLTLHHAQTNAAWEEWPNPKLLVLDNELLVGNSRSMKDSEGRRLPQKPERQDYRYVPLTGDDYRAMIAAGMNLFPVTPAQEPWVRAEPVFYLRGVDGQPPLSYPADLYRANYLGPEMFMDEPSILMVGDTNIHRTLRAHEQRHPRASIFQPPPKTDVAIAVPDGYFLSLENLWWVRVMDKEGKNEASQRYQRLMRRALLAVHDCLDRHLSFDLTVDDGRKMTGYRKILRLTDAP